MSNYWNIAVDLETTNDGIDGSPDAIYPNNKMLTIGWASTTDSWSDDGYARFLAYVRKKSAHHKIRLIGQNIKFDLKYLLRDLPALFDLDLDIWDTEYFDYRYEGQRDMSRKLEDLCAKWKVPYTKRLDLDTWLKDNKMTDIPTTDLLNYVREDAEATHKLYNAQRTSVSSACEYFTGHIIPLAMMELVGLPLDRAHTEALAHTQLQSVVTNSKNVWEICEEYLSWSHGLDLDKKHLKHTSARTLSYLLTGEPSTGLNKRAKGRLIFKPNRSKLLNQKIIDHVWPGETPNNLGYSMDEDHLERLVTVLNRAPVRTKAHDLVDAVYTHRKANKMFNTYLSFMLEQAAETGGTIHPNINLCVTSTGRTSSSKPNGQNMPPEVRGCIQSHYGNLIEIDFKQLEVYAAAILSGDPQLLDDLIHGRDVHYEIGKTVMGWKTPADQTEETRRAVKAVTFGILYGAGAAGISDSSGLPIAQAKALIKEFYKRYPMIRQWHIDMTEEVHDNRQVHGFKDGEQVYISSYGIPYDNRYWAYTEKAAPDWVRRKTGRKFDFKVTEIKNYPVQGFAGGDIVMVAIALLNHVIRHMPCTVLRLTVHDSILVDTDQDPSVIDNKMSQVIKLLTGWFNLPVDLKYEMKSSGTHWSK
jgi:DNA polymerase I-like protein with 3'-5' exonuclease and polymerase domains